MINYRNISHNILELFHYCIGTIPIYYGYSSHNQYRIDSYNDNFIIRTIPIMIWKNSHIFLSVYVFCTSICQLFSVFRNDEETYRIDLILPVKVLLLVPQSSGCGYEEKESKQVFTNY